MQERTRQPAAWTAQIDAPTLRARWVGRGMRRFLQATGGVLVAAILQQEQHIRERVSDSIRQVLERRCHCVLPNLLDDLTAEFVERHPLDTDPGMAAAHFADKAVQDRTREALRSMIAAVRRDDVNAEAEASRRFQELAFAVIDVGVRQGARAGAPQRESSLDDEARGAYVAFTTQKLTQVGFLAKLARHDQPLAGLFTSARNFAFDHSARSSEPPPNRRHDPPSGDEGSDPLERARSGDATPEEAVALRRRLERARDAVHHRLRSLSTYKQSLLFVYHAERFDPPGYIVVFLVQRRIERCGQDATEAGISAEIAQRRTSQDSKRDRAKHLVELNRTELLRLQAFSAEVRELIADLDGCFSDAPTPPDEFETTPEWRQLRILRSQTPDLRTGYYDHLSARVSQVAHQYRNAAARANKTHPAGPGYEEVARIVSNLCGCESDKERAKIVNTTSRAIRYSAAEAKNLVDTEEVADD